MVRSLSLFRVRTSWTVLGPSGRELAVRGIGELCEAAATSGLAAELVVARGLAGRVDLALYASAPEALAVESFLQALAVRTAGRHLKLLDRRLSFASEPLPAGDALGFASVRGPLDPSAEAQIRALAAESPSVLWRTVGPGGSDHLLATAAPSLEPIARFYERLPGCDALAAVPITVLALGRRLPLEEAFARFSYSSG